MGSVDDFLSYFVMGPEGVQTFARGATVNTDENLYLEFSAPFSYDREFQEAENMESLLIHRESIRPYLTDPGDPMLRDRQKKKWMAYEKALQLTDEAHKLILWRRTSSPEFRDLAVNLDRDSPSLAPWVSIRSEIR
jgi:spermidine synthase